MSFAFSSRIFWHIHYWEHFASAFSLFITFSLLYTWSLIRWVWQKAHDIYIHKQYLWHFRHMDAIDRQWGPLMDYLLPRPRFRFRVSAMGFLQGYLIRSITHLWFTTRYSRSSHWSPRRCKPAAKSTECKKPLNSASPARASFSTSPLSICLPAAALLAGYYKILVIMP